MIRKTLGDGITIIADDAEEGGANCGRLNVQIDGADSAKLSGEYIHDCRLLDESGESSRIFYGHGSIMPASH